jgi:hypothetical protein
VLNQTQILVMDAIEITSDLMITGSTEAIEQVLYRHNMEQLMSGMDVLEGALVDILHLQLLWTSCTSSCYGQTAPPAGVDKLRLQLLWTNCTSSCYGHTAPPAVMDKLHLQLLWTNCASTTHCTQPLCGKGVDA